MRNFPEGEPDMIDLYTLSALEWLALPAIAVLLTVGLLAGSVRRTRLARRVHDMELQLAEAVARLGAAELALGEYATESENLRRDVAGIGERHDRLAATRAHNNGLRQAIALSRHGATTRQLVDTCGLSQGEAHLVQTLYGRAAAEPSTDATRH